jgi:hypothetical protein
MSFFLQKRQKKKTLSPNRELKRVHQIIEGPSHQVQKPWYQIMHIEQRKAKLSLI